MRPMTDVAIVGAGPYGLSLAAHLSAMGLAIRIFGVPMHTWRTSMPEGMVLKSEGFASTLYDPGRTYTLETHCAKEGLPYADIGLPVPLETFATYGMTFQKRLVPMLDERLVTSLRRTTDGFELQIDNDEIVTARRVVVAAGIRRFANIPAELDGMRGPLLTHSADHHSLSEFAGKEVLVVGGGASGIELAGLMHRNGARPTVAARRARIAYCDPPRPRTLLDKIREPVSGLGTGWRSLAAERAPMVFYHMPQDFRLLVVRKHLGPAPGWTSRDEVERHVPVLLGSQVASAREVNGRAEVVLNMANGPAKTMSVDHVVSATGYKVDLRRLGFLAPDMLARIRSVVHTPVLSRHFESSIPDLYFVGSTAANSFGPMLRFACGAEFASERLSRHLLRTAVKRTAVRGQTLVPAET
jgi:hypothetical protein